MSKNKTIRNQYGLSRTIPRLIKRKIRQSCGFGCMICGCGIYQYEHINPTFEDAKKHDPNKMGLLCGMHHDLVTRGLWSKERAMEARKDPRCLQDGFARWDLDLGQQEPDIKFGKTIFSASKVVLRIFGEDILAIHPSEKDGSPVRIYGRFVDQDGKETLRIVDNEIISFTEHWDIETVGGKATIRRGPGNIALQLGIVPRQHIAVEKLEMCYRKVRVSVDGEGIRIGRVSSQAHAVDFNGGIHKAECCLDISEEDPKTDYGSERTGFLIRGNVRCTNNIAIGCVGSSFTLLRDGLCIAFGVKARFSTMNEN
jgi:hypothetical protein